MRKIKKKFDIEDKYIKEYQRFIENSNKTLESISIYCIYSDREKGSVGDCPTPNILIN